MMRRQWFAAGVISLLAFLTNLFYYWDFSRAGRDFLGEWIAVMPLLFVGAQIFGVMTLIFFVCGFMERKEEKK
jgi:hypothetical protein